MAGLLKVVAITGTCATGIWGVGQLVKQAQEKFEPSPQKTKKTNKDMYYEAFVFTSTKPHKDWWCGSFEKMRAYSLAKDAMAACRYQTSSTCTDTYSTWNLYLKESGLGDYEHKS